MKKKIKAWAVINRIGNIASIHLKKVDAIEWCYEWMGQKVILVEIIINPKKI